MSFSSDVKKELSELTQSGRHCQIAEIASIISICGRISFNSKKKYLLKIYTENLTVAKKYYMLIRDAFQYKADIVVRRNCSGKKSKSYLVVVKNPQIAYAVLKASHFIDESDNIEETLTVIDNIVIQNACCKRAFIRGSFLAAGSISTPVKTYHFEVVLPTKDKAVQLQEVINTFLIGAKIVQRKKQFVVYVKDGSRIVDVLNVMEAHKSLMDLENVRILKEMRNSINRQVNCETANINKTVTAASKQVEDIIYLKNTMGLENLTEGLEEIARIRLEQQEASLKELGELVSPPIGKSGVNHRLRKLSIIADQLRKQKEDVL